VPEPVKCVVWDLDGTIWRGVAVETPAGRQPEPIPRARHAIETLERRGILNSLASRTDPSVAMLIDGDPGLAGRFVAAQLGWGHKSDAIRRIAAELGIDPAAIAFVDDDPFERAEVAALLPAVLVLSPDELYERLDTPRFRPAVITEDGRHRLARYHEQRHRRDAERSFTGDRAEFLRQCRIRLSVAPAELSDLDRLAELVTRTHRFNSTGAPWSRERLAQLVEDDRWFVPVARLSDRFGDYGLIGAALVEWAEPAPRLHLFMVSCRAVGRGAPAAFLGWILARARAAGAERMLMDVLPQQANLELRVLLRRSGFHAIEGAGLLERRLDADPPAQEAWLAVVELHDRPNVGDIGTIMAAEATIRELLAGALGVEQAAVDRLPAAADLLHGPLPLTSLAGARLLAGIRRRFGVDVADEDLALDSLRSIAALRDFVAARSGDSAAAMQSATTQRTHAAPPDQAGARLPDRGPPGSPG
jgi:FkbH-like protein